MAHPEVGQDLLGRILDQLSDVAIADNKPVMAGRNLNVIIRSNPNAKAKDA